MSRLHLLILGVGSNLLLLGCSPSLPTNLPPLLASKHPSHYIVDDDRTAAQAPVRPIHNQTGSNKKAVPSKRDTLKKPPKAPKAIRKPKEQVKLQKVEDTNFDPDYMYPETSHPQKKAPKKATPASSTPATDTMDKARCVKMLGQEKFARFVTMLGSEAATIKRCALMQRMR